MTVTPWEGYPGWPPIERLLKVAETSIDRAVEACAPSCHALPRTELHGDVVRWGAAAGRTGAPAAADGRARHAPLRRL